MCPGVINFPMVFPQTLHSFRLYITQNYAQLHGKRGFAYKGRLWAAGQARAWWGLKNDRSVVFASVASGRRFAREGGRGEGARRNTNYGSLFSLLVAFPSNHNFRGRRFLSQSI